MFLYFQNSFLIFLGIIAVFNATENTQHHLRGDKKCGGGGGGGYDQKNEVDLIDEP